MPSTVLLTASVVLLAFAGCAHSYLGERYLFPRLFALVDLPLFRRDRKYTENVLRYAWHLTSVAWWGFAAMLIAIMMNVATGRVVDAIVGITLLLTGIVVTATAGTRHPAWWIFLLAGALALVATW